MTTTPTNYTQEQQKYWDEVDRQIAEARRTIRRTKVYTLERAREDGYVDVSEAKHDAMYYGWDISVDRNGDFRWVFPEEA